MICSGELGQPSLEDSACAGLLVARLASDLPDAVLTAAAEEARTLIGAYAKDLGRLAQDAPHARSLARKGRGADLAACLALDASAVVPTRVPGVDKLVWTP
jgi:2-phosphosulfolactate phosphatase